MYPKPFKRKNRKTYYFFYTLNGKRYLKNTGEIRVTHAQKYIREFIDQRSSGSHKTFKEYAKPFTQWETSPRVRRYIIEGKSIGKEHVSAQGSFLLRNVFSDPIADKPIREITTGDVIDFRERIFAKYNKIPNAANKTFIAFKVVLSEAALRRDITTNPAAGIGKINYTMKEKILLPLEKIISLFSIPWENQLAYQIFRLTAFTGMRGSEVMALHWEQLEDDVLTIDRAWKSNTELGTTKSGKTRTIPLAPSVLEHLPKRGANKSLIFCYKDGSRLGKTWWKKNWNAIIVGEKEQEDGTKKPIKMSDIGVTPHSLRHSLNSNLITSGVPLQFIQEYLGWSRTGLTAVQQGYTHITPDALRVVAQAIDRMYLKKDNVILMKKKA